MSGTNVGNEPHTDADVTPDQKPSDADSYSRIPDGYAIEHHTPDTFLVRCTSCGHLKDYSSRARAHRKADHHGLRCAPTGVAPLTELEVVTDGGQCMDDTEQWSPTKDPFACSLCGGYQNESQRVTGHGYCRDCCQEGGA